MSFVKVKNEVILAGPMDLPNSWGNVSGLHRASENELIGLGWFPVVENIPEHNPAIQVLVGPVVSFTASNVVLDYSIRAYNGDEEILRDSDYWKNGKIVSVTSLVEAEKYLSLGYYRVINNTRPLEENEYVDGQVEVIDEDNNTITISDDIQTRSPEEMVNLVNDARDAAKKKVNTDAELARNKYITPGAGQAVVYLQKATEAKNYQLAESNGDDIINGEYPLMNDRASRLGIGLDEVADEWSTKSAIWLPKSVQIEGVREKANQDLDGAMKISKINEVIGSIIWP